MLYTSWVTYFYSVVEHIITIHYISCFRLPYAELVEPFSAWYDGKKNRSRVAFYGTTMQTYMIGGDGKHGMSYKLAYMTNQTHMNMHGCFKAEGMYFFLGFLESYNFGLVVY